MHPAAGTVQRVQLTSSRNFTGMPQIPSPATSQNSEPRVTAQSSAASSQQATKSDRRDTWPLMTHAELLTNSPSLRDGIDQRRQNFLRYAYCEFIKEAGIGLKFPQLTIATAVVFCHRFFSRHSFAPKENDVKVIATACLFLAGKVEETPKPLSEVITKTYLIRHKKDGKEATMEKLKRKEVYEEYKDKVLVAERRILHALDFCFNVDHAYKHVLLTVKKSVSANPEIAQVAWNFVNDSLRTLLSLQHEPLKIAVTVVHLASKFLKITIEGDGSAPWWRAHKVEQHELEDISNQILDLYCKTGLPAGSCQVSSTSMSEGTTTKSAAAASSQQTSQMRPSSAQSTRPPPLQQSSFSKSHVPIQLPHHHPPSSTEGSSQSLPITQAGSSLGGVPQPAHAYVPQSANAGHPVGSTEKRPREDEEAALNSKMPRVGLS